MLYINIIISVLSTLIMILPVLLVVAFVTVAERKTMASMQRRLGPNIVGYYGLLQAFADALKLLLKEYVSPTQANIILFFMGPLITLIFSLLGYAVIPYAAGLSLFDSNLGILYMLAVSSIATYGILLAGWSANSKYAFLGSLRSTAQLISYELVLSSAIFLVIILTSSLNITVNVEVQKCVWFILPLLPVFIIFFIAAVAETNRAPFDLAEAESELVSGFMTEHSAVIFVFFFLAEYASIILMCILISILFLGGYNVNFEYIIPLTDVIYFVFVNILHLSTIIIDSIIDGEQYVLDLDYLTSIDIPAKGVDHMYFKRSYVLDQKQASFFFCEVFLKGPISYINPKDPVTAQKILFEQDIMCLNMENWIINNQMQSILCGATLALKSFVMAFIFIWVRASFPRIRFDQLMSYCWTVLLPLVFSFITLIPCIVYVFDMLPNNVSFS